jgi:hypothetical protein
MATKKILAAAAIVLVASCDRHRPSSGDEKAIVPDKRSSDPQRLIAAWQQRLAALVEHPPYVFVETPPELIEQYRRRRTTFRGYDEPTIAAAERDLGVRFPRVFRAYLREMGRASGELFEREDVMLRDGDAKNFRADAAKLLRAADPPLTLPDRSVVFVSHQGHEIIYFVADREDDSTCYRFIEGEHAPTRIADSFAQLVDRSLDEMESRAQADRTNWIIEKTIHPDGSVTETMRGR